MKKFLKNNYWLLFLIPSFFVFKNLFFGKLFYGGDAPFYYLETISDLFANPQVWIERGYPFGGIGLAIWLSPIMILYGALGKFLSLGNDAIIRIIFIIPSIVLSFFGPYFFTKYLRLDKNVQFFTVLVYVFNTYYLLLLDGGQVGVALAYGIFPITLSFLKKFIDNVNSNSFLIALFFSTILSIIDPRILMICFLVIFVWSILEKKFNLWLFFLGFLLILINLYWIYPILRLGSGGVGNSVSDLGLLSLINPLMLFSPHWPANLFGKISYPPFYFIFVPVLIFGSIFIKKEKRVLTFALMFLIFSFLTKGKTPPLGIDLGFIFRDTSKFFMPVILFAGILIGKTLSYFKNDLWRVAGYIFILTLIAPVFLGKMNFMLSNKISDESYSKIANEITSQDQEYRTVWFTNKNSLTFDTKGNPAIDGTSLVNFWPFVQMNGSEDVFNFLNNKDFINWFRILGVKYVFLNGDARNVSPTTTDIKNWNTINDLFNKQTNLKKLDWGLNFVGYEIDNPYPKSYFVDNLIGIVGSSKLETGEIFAPSIYFEDGKWDPETILNKDDGSIKLYFNNSEKLDLTMSLLQKYFISPSKHKISKWSIFNSSEYLKYKYQLLIRGFEFSDFDYGLGIAFSSNVGESIGFEFDVPREGDYILAKRIANLDNQKLTWFIEEKYLRKGSHEFLITNNINLLVLNTVLLIPKEDYQNAYLLTDQILEKFEVVSSIDNSETLKRTDVNNKGYWLVFSDNYSSWWRLRNEDEYYKSYPVYSMLNAFYVDPQWTSYKVEFIGQSFFKWGVLGSLATVIVLVFIFLIEKNHNALKIIFTRRKP